MKNNIHIDLIIPIRVYSDNIYILNRLLKILEFFVLYKNLGIIVVDSSEKIKYRQEILQKISNFSNVKYLYYKINNIYSAAKARNFGVKNSSSKYILFYDVDLLVSDLFIKKIFEDIQKIENNKKKNLFFIYPCLYLSENFTRSIEKYNQINFSEIKKSYLEGFNDKVLYLAVSTSTILVNKEHFIKIGMYDENFKGHGYEDFELIHRLYLNYVSCKIDEDYLIDFKTNFPAKYKGFRKYFAYMALPNFFRDMYTIHLWHPRPLSKKYYKVRKKNQKYFLRKISLDLKKYQYNKNENLMLYDKFIEDLLNEFDTSLYCGLYKYNDSVNPPKKTMKRKLRKLLLNPIQFFKDIKLK